jgi:hypothetical protein
VLEIYPSPKDPAGFEVPIDYPLRLQAVGKESVVNPKSESLFDLFRLESEWPSFVHVQFPGGESKNNSFRSEVRDDWNSQTGGFPPPLKKYRIRIGASARNRPKVRAEFTLRFVESEDGKRTDAIFTKGWTPEAESTTTIPVADLSAN